MFNVPVGKRALITGGTGFIGRVLIAELRRRHVPINILSRNPPDPSSGDANINSTRGDLTAPGSLGSLCRDVDTVFHLAGRAHAGDVRAGEDQLHQRVTVDGTRALLRLATQADVRRLVFVSTVKAIDDGGDECRDESTIAAPRTAYGRAKLAAEQMIFSWAAEQGAHAVVLRLPLVYGPGAKGNLMRMLDGIARRRFPPVPETHNKRSMVHAADVARAALLAATKQVAGGKVYIVTDGETYSTRQIYKRMRSALGLSTSRWAVPNAVLRIGATAGDVVNRLANRSVLFDSDTYQKLLGSAWYSSAKISRELGFRPTHTFWDTLPTLVSEYRSSR